MREIIEFPIHFDVPGHYLKIDDFVSFSIDLEKIVTEFNKKIFRTDASVEIFILPPESGTLLAVWGINFAVTSLSVGSLFMALDTDISKGFVKGLTGHEPSYYAKIAGSEAKKGALLLADAARWFLAEDDNDVNQEIVNNVNFPEAYFAKNDFYKKCLANNEISGIGFTRGDSFSIKRDTFSHKIVDLSNANLELATEYEIHQLRVVSPVNTLESRAQWHLQDMQTHRALLAHLKDENFRANFFSGKYPLKFHETDDTIIAMIEYKKANIEGVIKIVERNIIRIYKFNNIVFDEIPKRMTILSVSKIKSGASERQLSFFDR